MPWTEGSFDVTEAMLGAPFEVPVLSTGQG
jgi:hypothetical protein